MANENKDKFIHICGLMHAFGQTMRKSQVTHQDLMITYEENIDRLEVSLTAQVTFKNLKYGHWILFFYDTDGWHVDNTIRDITELTDTSHKAGVMHYGTDDIKFETIDTFRQYVKDMYDQSNPVIMNDTAQMWQAIGKISMLLEQHVMLA